MINLEALINFVYACLVLTEYVKWLLLFSLVLGLFALHELTKVGQDYLQERYSDQEAIRQVAIRREISRFEVLGLL